MSVWDLQTGRVVRTISSDGTPYGDGFEDGFAFALDGKLLLSADQPGERERGFKGEALSSRLHLWDFYSGKLLKRSPELDHVPKRLAIQSDGRMAAFATSFGDVFLWDLEMNEGRRVVVGDGCHMIDGLSFTGDGKHLVVLTREGGVSRRIDVASGKVLKKVDLGDYNWADLSPYDGSIATCSYTATGSYPDQLYLYDTLTGAKRRLPLKDKDKVGSLDLSFGPDGCTLLVQEENSEVVQFWDAAKGRLLRRLRVFGCVGEDGHTKGLSLSENGEWLTSYEEYREKRFRAAVLRVWNARTGQPHLPLSGHISPPVQLAFSADGKEVISYAHREKSPGGQLCRWEIATGKLLTRIFPDTPKEEKNSEAYDWQLAPGGQHLAARVGRAIYLYEASTGMRVALTDKAPPDSDWSFTPDGRAVVTIDPGRDVCLWDVTTGKLLRRLVLEKKGGKISWLQFAPDGRTLVTSEGWRNVRLWDGLVTSEGWRKFHLWDAATGKHRAAFTLPEKRVPFERPKDRGETAFSPDGRYLLVTNTTNLWIWDLVAGKEIGPFEQDNHEWRWILPGPGRVAVSPDGRLMAWCDEGLRLRLYEVCTGKIVHRLPEDCSSLAFAPSGWRLAVGCQADASVLIWDLPLLFRSQPLSSKDTDAESFWNIMASSDAVQVYRALWRLAALPEADVFLSRQLKPVEVVPPARVRALLVDLGSPDFATREKAVQALAAAGEPVRAAVKEVLARTKDIEVRRRLELLQERLQPQSSERLRELRAVLVLEARGTAEARRLLQRLATGQSEARLTQEAKAALTRLAR